MRFSCAVPCGPRMVPFHVRMYCSGARGEARGEARQRRPGGRRHRPVVREGFASTQARNSARRVLSPQHATRCVSPTRLETRGVAACGSQLAFVHCAESRAAARCSPLQRTRSSVSSRPYDTLPSPMPRSPRSSSSKRRKLRGTTVDVIWQRSHAQRAGGAAAGRGAARSGAAASTRDADCAAAAAGAERQARERRASVWA